MSRFAFALLSFTLVALAVSEVEPPAAAAQTTDKKKGKNKTAPKVEAPDPDPDAGPEDLSRVRPVFDPGAHTGRIIATGFTADGRKLITVGVDATVQVWNPATGERLDILRLPGYGRETHDSANTWDVAAISPDGSLVVVGGGPKTLTDDRADPVSLVLVDVARRQVRPVPLTTVVKPIVGAHRKDVTGVAFSPDGDRLAVAVRVASHRYGFVFSDVRKASSDPASGGLGKAAVGLNFAHKDQVVALAFSADGARLVAGDGRLNADRETRLEVWDVPPEGTPALAKGFVTECETLTLAWAPDGKSIVRSSLGRIIHPRQVEVWTPDGKLVKKWLATDAVANEGGTVVNSLLITARFTSPNTLFLAGRAAIRAKGQERVSGAYAGLLDVDTGKTTRLAFDSDDTTLGLCVGTVSPDGRRAAVCSSTRLEILVIDVAGAKVEARCGVRNPAPFLVGWSADPKAPGVGWSEERARRKSERAADLLRFGFDLTRVEPTTTLKIDATGLPRTSIGEWTLVHGTDTEPNNPNRIRFQQNGKTISTIVPSGVNSFTLVPTPEGPPLGVIGEVYGIGKHHAALRKTDGTIVAFLGPNPNSCRDVAPSPDGRYVVVSTGTSRLAVYRTAAPEKGRNAFPFLSLVSVNGEWVVWTAEGYYAASPGGEKLLGWAVQNGPRQLVTFHPAERFAKHFRRPDVIKLAIEKGSVAEALKLLQAKPADIEQILPPQTQLKLIEQRGATIKVRAAASSGAKDKPVLAMRLLLDGRPLPEGRGVWTGKSEMSAEAEWEVEAPAGSHEFKVMARSEDGPAISDALVVKTPIPKEKKPTLYRVCVGVNDYDQAGLKLNVAAKDARDVFGALERFCAGDDNRFGAAKGELMLDKDATRDRVLAALKTVRKQARPGDLVVFFFAGHGVKQNDAFYLLTREADPATELKGKALSGDDLRSELAGMPTPVLLIMDACHSAKGVKSLRPATDDLTRSLTDDEVGVTVLAAAMAHEVAGAEAENGYFTAALLKALAAGEGVPFDPYERQLYVHHLYSVVFSEVRKATNGRQNPFLNMPWTVSPLAVRLVSGK